MGDLFVPLLRLPLFKTSSSDSIVIVNILFSIFLFGASKKLFTRNFVHAPTYLLVTSLKENAQEVDINIVLHLYVL